MERSESASEAAVKCRAVVLDGLSPSSLTSSIVHSPQCMWAYLLIITFNTAWKGHREITRKGQKRSCLSRTGQLRTEFDILKDLALTWNDNKNNNAVNGLPFNYCVGRDGHF